MCAGVLHPRKPMLDFDEFHVYVWISTGKKTMNSHWMHKQPTESSCCAWMANGHVPTIPVHSILHVEFALNPCMFTKWDRDTWNWTRSSVAATPASKSADHSSARREEHMLHSQPTAIDTPLLITATMASEVDDRAGIKLFTWIGDHLTWKSLKKSNQK